MSGPRDPFLPAMEAVVKALDGTKKPKRVPTEEELEEARQYAGEVMRDYVRAKYGV